MRKNIYFVEFEIKEEADLSSFDNQKLLNEEQQTLPNIIIAGGYENAFYLVKELKLKYFALTNMSCKYDKVIIKGEVNEEVRN